jgi:CDP-glycerol glycerophosphotransferase (TagB/SpsB family)
LNVQDYIVPLYYKPLWSLLKLFRLTSGVAFYCADPLDYEMFKPIYKNFDFPINFIAKNKKTRDFFKANNISYKRIPSFPDVVIMARQTAYKFPHNGIIKIGFDHGLYQFKRWTSTKYYNMFDVYFMSSENQVETAKERGINTAVVIGYPKLDQAFDGTFDEFTLSKIKSDLNLDPNKKTLIFTSTWNVDGLSALDRWVDKVGSLADKYNILLTAHTWTEQKYIDIMKNTHGAVYLDEFDVTKYLLISDVFIGDYNSLIGEFCALDKPIITFRTPESSRSVPDVRELISNISIQIDSFDEIETAIERCLSNPDELSVERNNANKLIHYRLDGNAGKRAADIIKELCRMDIN